MLQSEGRFEETILPLREHLEERPRDIELNRMLGLALIAADSASTAVWVLRRVSEHPEHTANDLVVLGEAYARTGAHAYALESCEGALALEPDHPGALMLCMNAASVLERWDDVVDSTDRILKENASRPRVQRTRAEALIALEQLDEAEEAIATGRASPGARADPSLDAAFCQLELSLAERRGQDDRIDAHLDACLARTGGSQELLDYALELYDGRDEGERATAVLERALSATPRRLELRKQLADRLVVQGRTQEARELVRAATELEGAMQAWLLVAEFERGLEEHAAAARAAEQVLLARDTVPELVMAEYGDDLVRAGELEKAEEVIGRINRPEWAALLRGRLLLAQGDPAAAMEALQDGIRLWPGNGTARLLAGRAAERLGDFDQAILEYRNALRSDIESTSAVFELAGLHEAEGHYLAAYFPLSLRMQRNSEDEEAGLALVRIALLGENVPLASTTAKTLGASGHPVAELLAEAMIAQASEGPAAAAERLLSSDLHGVAHAEVMEALVGYLISAGRGAEALSWAQRGARENPSASAFQALHALALRAQGRDRTAQEAYERSLALDPENARALVGLAELTAEAGNRAEAIELYDRASSADPDDASADSDHADADWAAVLLAVEVESAAQVDERLEALLYDHPRHAGAAQLLARRRLEGGADPALADELARRAIRFRGGAEALEIGGRVSHALGDTARALRLLRRAVELRPETPATRYHLALALLAADRPVAAREALESALAGEEFAESSAARETLARLTQEEGGDE